MSIKIEVLNASKCLVYKNQKHYDLIRDILSYNRTYRDRRTGHLVRDKGSLFGSKEYGPGRFGTGLLRHIKSELEKKGETVEIIWKDKPNRVELYDPTLNGIVYEDYQKEILDLIGYNNTRGIFQASTGAGKTIITSGIIKKLGIPKSMLVVPSINIGKKSKKSLEETLGVPIGMLGASSKELRRTNIVLYHSLKTYDLKEVNNKISTIFIDEAHIAPQAISNILMQLPDVWYRYGFTATPILKKEQTKEWLTITAQLGNILSVVTDEQASSRVTDVNIIMYKFNGEKTVDDYMISYRKDVLLSTKRCELIVDMIWDALFKYDKKNVLVLVDEYNQAAKIERILKEYNFPKTVVVWSGVKDKQMEIIDDINNGKFPISIATPIFKVGTDIPNVDSIILGSARQDYKDTLQKIGRGRRRTDDKDVLLVLDIYDKIGANDKHFEKFSKSRLNLYKQKGWFGGFANESESGNS